MSNQTSLKQLAKKTNVPQYKIKGVSEELFGSELEEFTDEQVQQIQNALMAATSLTSEVKAITQAIQEQVSSEITHQNPVAAISENLTQLYEQPAKVAKIQQILGTNTIKKNASYWQQLSFIRIKKALAEQEKMLIAFRANSTAMVNQTFRDMTDDIRNDFAITRRNWFDLMTGDLTEELDALSKLEVDLERSESEYEKNLREALDELMTLG